MQAWCHRSLGFATNISIECPVIDNNYINDENEISIKKGYIKKGKKVSPPVVG